MNKWRPDPASYKDPAGFVFIQDGLYFRSVQDSYASAYTQLMESGLYDHLVANGWILPHEEVEANDRFPAAFKTLFPRQLSFISYPYEWSFDMLRDAATLSLKINLAAIERGMILKDATPFNIQFNQGKPLLMDTLSFERYDASQPWVAYRQFCQTFLFPLYLEHYLQAGQIRLLGINPEGVDAATTARLLPAKSWLNTAALLHVHLQTFVGEGKKSGKAGAFTSDKMKRLLQHLLENLSALRFQGGGAGWSNYYDETILSKEYLEAKVRVFEQMADAVSFKSVLDLGANDGHFSLLLAERNKEVIAVDFDAACINRLYATVKEKKIGNLLPLIIDLANPSPAGGFANSERPAFLNRIQPDLVTALALVHHLAITRYIQFSMLSEFFRRIAPALIIEFVPPEDPKVIQLIGERTDTFSWYRQEHFESAFGQHFDILQAVAVPGSSRTLYLMNRKPLLAASEKQ